MIGGAEIYRLFEPIADRLEITQVAASPPGDARIDAADPARWEEVMREDHPAQDDVPAFSYLTLRRRSS